MSDVQLDAVAAGLAASIVRAGDGTLIIVPEAAVDKARAGLRAGTGSVEHLVALAAKVHRMAGPGGLAVVSTIVELVVEALGAQDAADRFAKAGLDARAVIGAAAKKNAPRAKDEAAPQPKPRRGLR